MEIIKFTARDGRVFHSNQKMTSDDVRDFAGRVGGLHQVDVVDMTEAEYFAIPATVDSAAAFGQI